jgi:hypothetical protein
MYQKPPGLEAALIRDRELADKKQVRTSSRLCCFKNAYLHCWLLHSRCTGAGLCKLVGLHVAACCFDAAVMVMQVQAG